MKEAGLEPSKEEIFVGLCSLGFLLLVAGLFVLKAATGDGFNQMMVYMAFFGAVPLLAAGGIFLLQRGSLVTAAAPAALQSNLARMGR